MKTVLVICLIALASAAPRPQDDIVEAAPEAALEAVPEAAPEAAPAPPPVAAPRAAPAPPPVAAPISQGETVAILRDERVDQGDGNFNYAFEADNGISMQVSGTPGSEGQSNMEGVYLLPLPDGGFAEVRFVANENGFQPQSELLPTPHPNPPHVEELLRIAEQQRAEGITFE